EDGIRDFHVTGVQTCALPISSWPPHLALAFANDPANLVPTSAATNQDKGADDAARWLPPNAGYHCAYAVQQVQVKAAYDVGVTSEEHAALREALAGCRRSEEHTSELQSRENLVCRLLLEKKK